MQFKKARWHHWERTYGIQEVLKQLTAAAEGPEDRRVIMLGSVGRVLGVRLETLQALLQTLLWRFIPASSRVISLCCDDPWRGLRLEILAPQVTHAFQTFAGVPAEGVERTTVRDLLQLDASVQIVSHLRVPLGWAITATQLVMARLGGIMTIHTKDASHNALPSDEAVNLRRVVVSPALALFEKAAVSEYERLKKKGLVEPYKVPRTVLALRQKCYDFAQAHEGSVVWLWSEGCPGEIPGVQYPPDPPQPPPPGSVIVGMG